MGVKNLWDILESCKKTLPLHHLQNKRVCVDLSCWMVQLQNVNRSHCAMRDKLYLRGLFHRLRALIALNCSLIFVTDGSIPAIKLSTYRRRLNPLDEATIDAGNASKVSAVKRNMGSEFSVMVKEAKLLGGALGIPCLDGIEEAEAQCALLNSESLCDGFFTSDSDAFLFGARTVYRDICLEKGGYVVCYEMDDIERKLGFGRNSLIALALLLGCDYTQGVRGFGPDSACKIVKSSGDSVVLQRFLSDWEAIIKKPKESKKKGQNFTCDNKENFVGQEKYLNGSKCNVQSNDNFLQVINAYLKPKCHPADSDAVNRVLALYPFSHSQLQKICTQYFDWPPEKTDMYILPKIAERDLRRYNNLRSTSQKLGVDLPLNEIPVKCPISSIVKPRTLQGREYYEVSWEDMHGLKSSSVPADLVFSACPEKILEFQQRQAQKQRPARRPRPKKEDKKTTRLKEIDQKLNELLLEIEQENSSRSNASIFAGALPEKITTMIHIDKADENMHHSSDSKTNCPDFTENIFKRSSSSHSYSTALSCTETETIGLSRPEHSSIASSSMEMEVIDLMSPSPIKSKCQEAMCVDIIELTDMDNDVSPEHARKARELRSFLVTVRD